MREDRRRRYDDGFRREALEPVKAGAGKDTLARRLAMPRQTAEKWIILYKSGGEEAVMGGGSRRYDWETKVAASRDHVENGLTKTEAMARHGIASIAYLKAKVAYLEKLRALRASKSRGASEAPSSDCSQGGDTGSATS